MTLITWSKFITNKFVCSARVAAICWPWPLFGDIAAWMAWKPDPDKSAMFRSVRVDEVVRKSRVIGGARNGNPEYREWLVAVKRALSAAEGGYRYRDYLQAPSPPQTRLNTVWKTFKRPTIFSFCLSNPLLVPSYCSHQWTSWCFYKTTIQSNIF